MQTPSIQSSFGIDRMPWVIRVYIILVILLSFLMIFPSLDIVLIKPNEMMGKQIFSIASESLKIVIGALLGSLSMAASHQWSSAGYSKNKSIPQKAESEKHFKA